jgi:hypothetical protein
MLNRHRIVVAVVAVALAASLIMNLYFYLYVRVQDENVVNNMMTRALGSYAGQIDTAEYFLNEYLDTGNRSLLENEASWCAYSAEWAADVCRQSSGEEIYNQLWNTAPVLQSFGVYYVREGGTINETKLTTAISSLDHIWRFFAGFEFELKDESPIEYLMKVNGPNATANVIYYCQIAQDNLS